MVLKVKGEKWYTNYVDKKLPDLSDKIVAITGTTQGAGFWAAVATVRKNAKRLYLLNRDSDRATSSLEKLEKEKLDVQSETKIVQISCDLTSFKSVKEAVEQLQKENETEGRLDVLINNAGLIDDNGVTEDGYFKVSQVNALAPFLLISLLIEDLKKSPAARIVFMTTSFRFQYSFSIDDFNETDKEKPKKTKKKESERHYTSSKIACGLMSLELNERLKDTNIIVVSADPGLAKTKMLKDHLNPVMYAMLPSQAASDGSLTMLTAAYGENIYANDLLCPKGFMNVRGRPKKAIEKGKAQWRFNKEKKVLDREAALQFWEVCKSIGESNGVAKIQ